ncbi:MAG TPA: hypothetical protein VKS21_13820 [Spirochaetota bacterium]|nr:hypothetical protein [Spirochaetota bacterium]
MKKLIFTIFLIITACRQHSRINLLRYHPLPRTSLFRVTSLNIYPPELHPELKAKLKAAFRFSANQYGWFASFRPADVTGPKRRSATNSAFKLPAGVQDKTNLQELYQPQPMFLKQKPQAAAANHNKKQQPPGPVPPAAGPGESLTYTNFDNIINTALYLFCSRKPLVARQRKNTLTAGLVLSQPGADRHFLEVRLTLKNRQPVTDLPHLEQICSALFKKVSQTLAESAPD